MIDTALRTGRVKAEDSVTSIGPWEGAIKALSVCALGVNLGYLGLTSGFFDQLGHYLPPYRLTHVRVISILVAEHILVALRVLVDWLVPDVPDAVRVEAEREEYIQERIARDPRAQEDAPAPPPVVSETGLSPFAMPAEEEATPTVQTV